MKKALENLWYSYQMENPVKYDEKENQAVDRLIAAEKVLHQHLNGEQKEMLKKYEDCLDEMSGICEKNAFVKGVRFATEFLLEVLYR